MKQITDLKYLFEPRAVAVVGASANKEKIGHKILANILSSEYKGKVFPINPRGGRILGQKVYPSLLEVPQDVDLVCVAIPAPLVLSVVKDCASKKVQFLSIITSGFSEIGQNELEEKIVNLTRQHNMRILGPNVFGIYSAAAKLNATFGPAKIKPGNVAILTQSGALGIALMGRTETEGIGLSSIVSLGNKADLNESDFLEYFIHDKQTQVVFIYLEGLKDGPRFIRMLKQITKKKSVVILKAGKSKRGALAAASHTASLAGSNKAYNGISKQCGVIRAESVKDAISRIKYLSHSPLPAGENTVIITNGGGMGVLATDVCDRHKVKLFNDKPALKKIFSKVTPHFGSTKNPVDITGQAGVAEYQQALNQAINHPLVHSIICLGCQTAVLDLPKLAPVLEAVFKKAKANFKPIVFSFLGGVEVEAMIKDLKRKNIPIFNDSDEAVSCLGAAYFSYRFINAPREKLYFSQLDLPLIKEMIIKAKAEKRKLLLPHEAVNVMQAADISLPQDVVCSTAVQAVTAAEKIGYPVVLKVISHDILHKTETGGVLVNLNNSQQVKAGFSQIIKSCQTYRPEAKIEGIDVCEQVKAGVETMVGARHDPTYGPVVVFGLGGTLVEVFKDVNFRSVPLDLRQAKRMIRKTTIYTLLKGFRNSPRADIQALAQTILKLGTIIYHCPQISDIEINPLNVLENGKGVKALDVRILLS